MLLLDSQSAEAAGWPTYLKKRRGCQATDIIKLSCPSRCGEATMASLLLDLHATLSAKVLRYAIVIVPINSIDVRCAMAMSAPTCYFTPDSLHSSFSSRLIVRPDEAEGFPFLIHHPSLSAQCGVVDHLRYWRCRNSHPLYSHPVKVLQHVRLQM